MRFGNDRGKMNGTVPIFRVRTPIDPACSLW